jgi:hypothetical protein
MVASDIRSRPHTSAPAPDKCHIGLTFEQCQEVSAREKAEAAKAAREQVLKDLLYNIDGETGFYAFPHPKSTIGNGLSRFVLLDDLTALVESLRTNEHPSTKGGAR